MKWRGGGYQKDQKSKKKPTKIVGTGCIKIPMLLCCKPGLFCEIDPTKSQNGAGYRFQNGSLQKISPFWGGLVPFNGPKKSWAP